MKIVLDIAYECNVSRQEIHNSIKRLNLKPSKRNNHFIITPQQEELIHLNLYYLGKISEITFESKMNYSNNFL